MAARGFPGTPVGGCGPWPGLATVSLQLTTLFHADGRDTSRWVRGSRLAAPHPRPARSLGPPWRVSISENKTWPGSGLSYLHGGLGNMWSGLHFMKRLQLMTHFLCREIYGAAWFSWFPWG